MYASTSYQCIYSSFYQIGVAHILQAGNTGIETIMWMPCASEVQCRATITRSIFSEIITEDTP